MAAKMKVGILCAGFAEQGRDVTGIRSGLGNSASPLTHFRSTILTWEPKGQPIDHNNPPIVSTATNEQDPGGLDLELVTAHAQGDWRGLNDLAKALIRNAQKPAVLIGTSTPAIQALKGQRELAIKQTAVAGLSAPRDMPIIMAFTGDPKSAGIPVGNAAGITGIIDHFTDPIIGINQGITQLRYLIRLFNALHGTVEDEIMNVILAKNGANPGKEGEARDILDAALTGDYTDLHVQQLNIVQVGLSPLNRQNIAKALEQQFGDVGNTVIHGVVMLGDPFTFEVADDIKAYIAGRQRFGFNSQKMQPEKRQGSIPIIFGATESAKKGGLASYGPDHQKLFERAAGFLRRLLAKPDANFDSDPEVRLTHPDEADMKFAVNTDTFDLYSSKGTPLPGDLRAEAKDNIFPPP